MSKSNSSRTIQLANVNKAIAYITSITNIKLERTEKPTNNFKGYIEFILPRSTKLEPLIDAVIKNLGSKIKYFESRQDPGYQEFRFELPRRRCISISRRPGIGPQVALIELG